MNALKTTFLLTTLTLLLVLIGSRWGENGAIIAFVIAAGMNFFSYFFPTSWRWRCIGRSR